MNVQSVYEIQCEALKYQVIALERVVPQSNDFTVIKNQLAKQYFADYNPAKLKIISNMLGCRTIAHSWLLLVIILF